MQGSCQHRWTPFFWTLPYANRLARTQHFPDLCFLAHDRHRHRRAMQSAFKKIAAGVEDSQSVVLRDRSGMATTVLTLQQMGIAFVPSTNRPDANNAVNPSRTFDSRATCKAVPLRVQDETLVQQPSCEIPEGASLGSTSRPARI